LHSVSVPGHSLAVVQGTAPPVPVLVSPPIPLLLDVVASEPVLDVDPPEPSREES
jgi:hypothetical protein